MGTVRKNFEFLHASARRAIISAIGNCSATGCEYFLKQLNCHVSTSQHCVNIVTVLRCSKLSTIHSGYHCSSDPVQVQSLKSHGSFSARPTNAPPTFGATKLVQEVNAHCFLYLCYLGSSAKQLSMQASPVQQKYITVLQSR